MSAPSKERPAALLVVYNADGSLLGELRYIIGKTFRGATCAACDITHGSFGEKSDFVACKRRLGVKVELLHRDELGELHGEAGELPCVLARTEGGKVKRVFGPKELDLFGGDVGKFEEGLRRRLDEMGLGL
ncbi:hypothetical protein DFJ74DRAFT_685041 [Hyaloraphidium curvatum]|nr:hypothetical protein DFJ74DRAFT_685041 [Hyaloraphidium curvatum]